MEPYKLKAPVGANRPKRRVGRGQGSGLGTTSGRGNKGQQARSGGKVYPGFEGGQMPLYRRVPHRGFSNTRTAKKWRVVNLLQLEKLFETNTLVDLQSLCAKGLARKSDEYLKILGDGKVNKALTIKVHAVSEAARKKLEAAGGKIELIKAPQGKKP